MEYSTRPRYRTLMTRSCTAPFYARNGDEAADGLGAVFVFQIGFREPGGKVFVRSAWQGHAPDTVFSGAQANLPLAWAAFLANPHHHEPRPHVAALQAHDKAALQCRSHAV